MDAPKCRTCGERHWARIPCGGNAKVVVPPPRGSLVQHQKEDLSLSAVTAVMLTPLISVGRRGRPRIENRGQTIEAQKPWLAAGMSRAKVSAPEAIEVPIEVWNKLKCILQLKAGALMQTHVGFGVRSMARRTILYSAHTPKCSWWSFPRRRQSNT